MASKLGHRALAPFWYLAVGVYLMNHTYLTVWCFSVAPSANFYNGVKARPPSFDAILVSGRRRLSDESYIFDGMVFFCCAFGKFLQWRQSSAAEL
jgi:hypothetical protein